MGKLYDSFWNEYCPDGFESEDGDFLFQHSFAILKLAEGLDEDKVEQIREHNQKIINYIRTMQKKAYIDGVKKGVDYIMDKL